MNDAQYHKPSCSLSIDGKIVLSLDGGTYMYMNTVTKTSEIYTVPETGQELQIKLYGGMIEDNRGTFGQSTITLFVNGVEIRKLLTENPFNRGSNSNTDTWNINGY